MALVDQNIISQWRLDAGQMITELERTKGAIGGVEQAANRVQGRLRPMGEQMEKVRGAFALAGLAMDTTTGAAAAWLQAGVKIIAQGGLLAGAITGVTIAVGKLVEHLKEAEENQRRLTGALGIFGVTKADVDAVRGAFEDVTEQQAIAIATTARQAGLARDEIEKLSSIAQLEAMRTGQAIDQAFSAVLRFTGEGTAEAVQAAQARVREIRQEVLRLNREISSLTQRGFGSGAISPLEARRDELLREGELLRGGQAGLEALENRRAAEQLAQARQRAAGRQGLGGGRARPAAATGDPFADIQGRVSADIWEQQAKEQIDREARLQGDIDAVQEEARQRRFAATLEFIERKQAAEKKAAEDAKRIEQAATEQRIAIATTYFDVALGGVRQLVDAFGAGSKEQTKAALEGIAKQAAIEAAFMAAKALFLLAIAPTQAGPAFAAAGAMASVAAAAGVASAALPSGGGGGTSAGGSAFGGAAGGGTSPSSFGGAPSGSDAGRGSAPSVTVVFNTRGFVTDAEVGKAVDRALREYERLRGT